jgi:hypothetical protein
MFDNKGQIFTLGVSTLLGFLAGYAYLKTKGEEEKIALYQEQAILMEEIVNLQETLASCQKGML